MSGHGTIDTAVEATKHGAMAFLEKPITLQKLLRAVEQALAKPTQRIAAAVAGLRNDLAHPADSAIGGAIGLVENGDIIDIDIPKRSINVALSDTELARRRAAMEARGANAWKPQEVRPRKVSPALKVYAKMVTSADKGAVRDLSLLD